MPTFKWQMLNACNSVVFHVDRWTNRHQEYPRHIFFAQMNVYEAYTNYNQEIKHFIKTPLKYFVYLRVYLDLAVVFWPHLLAKTCHTKF
jgi:hypothetical protein